LIEKGESPDPLPTNWDSELYRLRPSDEWLEKTNFTLSSEEADFLNDHIQLCHSNTLLAVILNNRELIGIDCEFPWEYRGVDHSFKELKNDLWHAHAFSEVMHGAALLYNLILAELIKSEERISEYRIDLSEWWVSLQADPHRYMDWELDRFRDFIDHRLKARVSFMTWDFVGNWLQYVKSAKSIESLLASKEAKRLIEDREYRLKGGRARIGNPKARELWSGYSGTGQLDYRWNRPVKVIINDILTPSKRDKENA